MIAAGGVSGLAATRPAGIWSGVADAVVVTVVAGEGGSPMVLSASCTFGASASRFVVRVSVAPGAVASDRR